MSSKTLGQDDIDRMTVNDLKAELKVRGASLQGKKAELATRLADLCKAAPVEMEKITEEELVDATMNTAVVDSGSDREKFQTKEQPTINQTESVKGNDAGDVITQLPVIEVGQSARDVELQKPEEIQESFAENAFTAAELATPQLTRSSSSSIQDRVKEKMKAIQQQKSLSSNSADAFDPSSSSPQQSVRIDYFQRPLNTKLLLAWLSEVLDETISEDRLWIHAIKTHCYLDFPTHAAAQKCIDIISGKRYPASSTALLEASFTKISAKEAPLSTEAALKPGEWKIVFNDGLYDDVQNNSLQAKQTEIEAVSSSLRKRKIDGDNNTDIKREIPSIGTTFFQRATAGAIRTEGSVSEIKSKRKRKEAYDQVNQSADQPLESLFRKTTALPVIYWQPVPNEVAEQRRSSR